MNYRIISITLLIAGQTCFAQDRFDPKATEEKFNQIEQALNRQAAITQKAFELSLELNNKSLATCQRQATSNIMLGLFVTVTSGIDWYYDPNIRNFSLVTALTIYTVSNFIILMALRENLKKIESRFLNSFEDTTSDS